MLLLRNSYSAALPSSVGSPTSWDDGKVPRGSSSIPHQRSTSSGFAMMYKYREVSVPVSLLFPTRMPARTSLQPTRQHHHQQASYAESLSHNTRRHHLGPPTTSIPSVNRLLPSPTLFPRYSKSTRTISTTAIPAPSFPKTSGSPSAHLGTKAYQHAV